MTKLSASDVRLVRAAAGLAAHAPEQMRAAHLAEPLAELADRLAHEVTPAPAREQPILLRAA